MTDAELVSMAREGNQRAFAALATKHREKAWNVCLRICKNHHDAEDALQTALGLAWRNLSKFRGDSGFGTWLYRIASNCSLELIRRRKDVQSIDDDSLNYGGIQLEDHSVAFEKQLADHDIIADALEKIPEQAREALILQEVAGLKIAEIAEHQNASVSATKVRIHRARKSLLDILQYQM